MRRSSQGAGPLRVRNDGPTTPKPRSRASSSGVNRLSSGSSCLSSSLGRHSTARTSIGKRTSMGRLAIAGPPSKRRTSTRSYGHHDLKQDPRPISDRHFKEKCIRELMEFLSQHSYPHPLTSKILHSPSSKEFIRIFEFMYGLIQPGFKCSGKIEELFPQTLKALSYPFSISKSAMYAIGSPHMWPTLLAALTWLREQLEYMMSTDVERIIFPVNQDDFDSVPLPKLLFKHTEETYNLFMAGEDTFEELENAFAKELRKNSPGGDFEDLIHENKRLENELKNLEEKSDPMIQLKDTLSSIKLDTDKMQQYAEKLDQHQNQQATVLKNLQIEEQTIEADFEVIKKNNQRKQSILQTQVFSQADIQRINMERRTLQEQITAMETSKEEQEKLGWEEERCIAKDQEGIQKKCTRYNDLAQTFDLIPVTAENAHGIDFELRQSLEESNSNHFYNTIKPALTRMKSQCIDKVHELEESRLLGCNMLDQLNDQISEKESLVSSQEKKLQLLQNELDRKKTLQQQECEQCQLQVDALSAELRDIHSTESMSISEATLIRNNERKKFEKQSSDNKKKRKRYSAFLESALDLLCNHKMAIQAHMQKVVAEAQKKLEEEQAKDKKT